jgi:integral membrane protein (TIGR01906 family)
MVDVKVVVQNMLRFHNLLVLGLVAVGLLAWRMHWLDYFWLAVSTGGWVTIGLLVALGLTVVLAFNAFFTLFHKLLGFQGDTWLFSYSDTLIRLYPMNFWQDAFLLVGAISAVLALLLAFGARKLSEHYASRFEK